MKSIQNACKDVNTPLMNILFFSKQEENNINKIKHYNKK